MSSTRKTLERPAYNLPEAAATAAATAVEAAATAVGAEAAATAVDAEAAAAAVEAVEAVAAAAVVEAAGGGGSSLADGAIDIARSPRWGLTANRVSFSHAAHVDVRLTGSRLAG